MVLVGFVTGGRQLWLLPFTFGLALMWMWLLVKHAPQLEQLDARTARAQLKFPSNLAELRRLSATLSVYQSEQWHYTLLLFCSAYIFKQTFSIPGSVFLNMLSGALYGALPGCLLCSFLSTLGATLCYQLSYNSCRQLLLQLLNTRIQQLAKMINANRHQLLYVLLFMRLFPMTPNWFINVASPIVGVPRSLFIISVFLGLMPYNFVCAQGGNLMSSLTSMETLFSAWTLGKLLAMSLAMLLPLFCQRLLNKRASNIKFFRQY